MKHCRKLVRLLGCAGSVEAHDHAGTQGNIASSSHASSSARLVEEEEAHEEEEALLGKSLAAARVLRLSAARAARVLRL